VAIDTVRAAYQSLGEGDVEPLVSLIDPSMEWRGRRRLRRFWRFWRPPS
jgi:ketosteroid isomerase-like protein